MRNLSGRKRVDVSQYPGGAVGGIGPPISRRSAINRAGGISLALLSILFGLIVYQNLPDNFGLNPLVFVASLVPEGTGVNTQDRIFKILMLVIGIGVIATRWSLARDVLKRINIGFAIFMVLIPVSAVWSFDSAATLLRFVSLIAIVLVCFAISLAGWHRLRFQQMTIPALMYILVASLLFGMVYPDRIIELGDDLSLKGAWHGITLTKNQFGMAASIGVIICVNRWLAQEGRTLWAIVGAAIAFTGLLLSRSNTSLFAALVGVLFMVLVMRVPVIRQRYSTHVAVAITVILLLYELAIQNVIPGAYTLLSPIRSLTGKDTSLSGRTVIWEIMKQHIQAAPYLGTGYGAYWLGAYAGSPSFVYVYTMFFYPAEAHNGYLEIVNDLGYLGLVCLLVFIIAYIRQALDLMRTDRSQGAMYLALLFHQLVMNMSESEWFARDNVFTIVILGVVCMARALHESRPPARAEVSAAK